MEGVGSEIKFLKRNIQKLEHDLALLPGASAEKVVPLFEQHFGKVRPQAIPCDGGIQTEDRSDALFKRCIWIQIHCWNMPVSCA